MEINIKKSTLTKIIWGAVIFIGLIILQSLLAGGQGSAAANQDSATSLAPVDKIEVYHFHATQQCWSCITVGNYAQKAITEYLADEVASGKVEFRQINIELSENRDVVNKFRASGSSLFINVIRGGKDNIKEDVTVWQLVNNERQFKNYLANKLKAEFTK